MDPTKNKDHAEVAVTEINLPTTPPAQPRSSPPSTQAPYQPYNQTAFPPPPSSVPPQQQQYSQQYPQPGQQQQYQQQYAPYQPPAPAAQQYGFHIPQMNVPHFSMLGHHSQPTSQGMAGFQTAPTMPSPNPPSNGATPANANPAQNDPGTIFEVMGNGTTIRKHADGHKSTQHPDGTIVHTFLDGSTKTINRDGTESYYTPTVAKEDYVDKAFAMGAKHLGLHLSRNTQEKITDKGRGMFEKFTGKKVPAKWSN